MAVNWQLFTGDECDTEPMRASTKNRNIRHTPKQRLTHPWVRVDGELRPATWEEALTRVTEGFATTKAELGGKGFAVFSCSKSTNEMNYAAQKFARTVLGTNNIDSCNRT